VGPLRAGRSRPTVASRQGASAVEWTHDGPTLACADRRATCHGRSARRAALLRRPVPEGPGRGAQTGCAPPGSDHDRGRVGTRAPTRGRQSNLRCRYDGVVRGLIAGIACRLACTGPGAGPTAGKRWRRFPLPEPTKILSKFLIVRQLRRAAPSWD